LLPAQGVLQSGRNRRLPPLKGQENDTKLI
jgi:hypothetical protein